MFRLTFKNLLANKVRFALTTFGVMLAVSFVVSAFVLGDGLRSSFTDVSEDITAGVDIEVRNVADFGDAPPLSMSTVADVTAVDGVADAVAVVEAADDAVRPVKANGDFITTDGPPQLAFNWIDNDQLSPFSLVDGAPPEVGEFTIDLDSAEKHGFVIGNTYELIVPDGRASLTLSGTSSFGADNSTLGAVLMQMNTAESSELFGIDGITNVSVQVAEGANIADVQASIAAAIPTADVVDHATVLDETTKDFTNDIDIIGNILLGFGFVALFVSIFIIYNTFAIVLSQRIRELALLRTVGADPRQIRRSVLGEAFVVGVLASVGGIGGGILVAKGLEALFGLMGADLPAYPLILATRTLVAAVVIGIGITMLAAIGPARRASYGAADCGPQRRRRSRCCRFSHSQGQRLRTDRCRRARRRRRTVRYWLDDGHHRRSGVRCDLNVPRCHITQPARRRWCHRRTGLADAQAGRRRWPHGSEERSPQHTPHRHDGRRVDDRIDAGVDGARRR